MNPQENSAGGETPPSSQNQLQRQRPRQPPSTVNQESHTVNEPSLPPHADGGRGTPPSSSQSQLRIQEPRQPPPRAIWRPSVPLYRAEVGRVISRSFYNKLQQQRTLQDPLRVNQECHIINEEPSLPPHAAGERTPPSSSQRQLRIQEPRPPPSTTVSREFHIVNEPSLPLHAAGGRTLPSSSQRQLRIQEPRPPPSRVYKLSDLISAPFLRPYSAGGRKMSPSFHNQLQHQRPRQHPLGLNQESHIMKKPSRPVHAAGERKTPPFSPPSQLRIQEPGQPSVRVNNPSQLISEPSLPRYSAGRTMSPSFHNPLGVNQESHIIKKPSPSQNQLQLHAAGSAQQRPFRPLTDENILLGSSSVLPSSSMVSSSGISSSSVTPIIGVGLPSSSMVSSTGIPSPSSTTSSEDSVTGKPPANAASPSSPPASSG